MASAGNTGGNTYFPARSQYVVGVAGVTPNRARRPNSNYGPEIDVAAPFQTYSLDNISAPVYFEGTSASAPMISGLAALFKSTALSIINDREYFVDAMCSYRQWNSQTGCGVPDAWTTISKQGCHRLDLAPNGIIDIVDDQIMSYRYGASSWNWQYRVWYDLEPFLFPDGDIDIKDLQTIFGRNGMQCPN